MQADTGSTPKRKIKIKAIFPKGFLRNLEMESFKTRLSEEILSVVANSRDLIRPEAIRSFTNVPIMGKAALMARRALTEGPTDSQDAAIITNIVMDKFKLILNKYCRRSFMRRKKFMLNDSDSLENYSISASLCSEITENFNVESHRGKASQTNPESGINLDITLTSGDETTCGDTHKLPRVKDGFLSNNESPRPEEDFNLIVSLEPMQQQQQKVLTSTDKQRTEMSSDQQQQECDERLFEEKIDYDAQKFLEVALGDENYSTAESLHEQSMADLYTSSQDSDEASISTDQVSMLLSRSSSLYSDYSTKLRLPSNTCTSTPADDKPMYDYAQCSPPDSKASILMQEASVQHQIIMQTSKALNICLSSKQFKSSVEYVEAEKILLLALHKREVVLKELVKGEYEDVDNNESNCLGQVTISNLTFPLAEFNRLNECRWFFASVRCGTNILATEVTMAQESEVIRFQKSFRFDNLGADFEIVVNIYSLRVKNNMKSCSRDSKMDSEKKTTMCPSPNKLIIFQKRPQQYRRYSYERRQPSFILYGTTTIRIFDLAKLPSFKLSNVPRFSCIKETMSADLSSNISFSGTCTGFLTIGSEAGGCASWSRRWCHLTGYKLHYWNYPAEQEVVTPLGSIDLSYCVTSDISTVDREFCARPRTLLVETGRLSTPKDRNSLMVLCKSSYTITRHYLSADNSEDMVMWQKRLNAVVGALRSWNCMNCHLFF